MTELLFSPTEWGDDSIRQQLARLDSETRIFIDWCLERGFRIDFFGDRWAESERLHRPSGLTAFKPQQRKTPFGPRPMKLRHANIWGRPIRPSDPYDIKRVVKDFVFVANEPKKERQLDAMPDANGKILLSPEQIDLVMDLARCRYAPATFEKRFARDVAAQVAGEPHPRLTEKQWAVVQKMEHRYRKQLAALRRGRP